MSNTLGLSDFPEFIQKSFESTELNISAIKSKIEENFTKSAISEDIFCNAMDVVDSFEKGEKAQVGDTREWLGKQYQKTNEGWSFLEKENQDETEG